MKISDISFQGLTLEETRANYPHVIVISVAVWNEFEGRRDDKAQWVRDRGLIHEQDFFTDVTHLTEPLPSGEFTMVEIWAFKDASTAMLFKLSWG